MGIGRWDPFGELVSLREAMNNLLEESYVRPRAGGGAGGGSAAPAGLTLDVHETPEAFVVTASVPGVRPEDVDITVLGDTLRIGGQQRDDRQEQGQGSRWVLRERRFGAFERMVRLPTAVQSGAAEAEFKNGVLTVTLPKADEAKPRSIPVRANQSQGAQAQAIGVTSGGENEPRSAAAEGEAAPQATGQPL